jgi:NAD(P)-dependent dehydrogenase (short-subunit alcohol dehydrogenase family)
MNHLSGYANLLLYSGRKVERVSGTTADRVWFTTIRIKASGEKYMANNQKTVIVTGASQGIGAAVVKAFLERGYNVVGTSRNATKSAELKASDKLLLVDGDIGQVATAQKVVDAAIQKFGSIDVVINNAGIFIAKPFTDYTVEDSRALVSTNIDGYIYITQLAVKQMLAQKSGGSVVAISTSLVANPIAGVTSSVQMISKGGIEALTRSLALEYAKENIRFNAVAPGIVDTPLHKDNPKDFLKTLSPMGTISTSEEIASAVLYLTEAQQVTGEVLHVDGGSHSGKW